MKSVVESFNRALQGPQFTVIVENQLHHCIIDSLFMQFFPECMKTARTKYEECIPYQKEDIEFFAKFANDEVQCPPISVTQLNDKPSRCISLYKFKFYLDNILSTGWSEHGELLKPLNFYKSEV